jgi:magnesium-transporting ATPase (P-type)
MLNRSQTWINQHLLIGSKKRRNLVLFFLFSLVLISGIFSKQIQHGLDESYYFIFQKIGLRNMLKNSRQTVSTRLTKGNWISMVSYAVMYIFLCFTTLHFYFNNARKTLTTLSIYLVLLGLCVLLVLIGKGLGDIAWPLLLTRRIIEILISPLPVIFLMAALRSPANKTKLA